MGFQGRKGMGSGIADPKRAPEFLLKKIEGTNGGGVGS